MDFDVLLGGVPWDFVTFPDYLESVEITTVLDPSRPEYAEFGTGQ